MSSSRQVRPSRTPTVACIAALLMFPGTGIVPAQAQSADSHETVAVLAIEWSLSRFGLEPGSGTVLEIPNVQIHADSARNLASAGRIASSLGVIARADALSCPPAAAQCTMAEDVTHLVRVRVEPAPDGSGRYIAHIMILEPGGSERTAGGRRVRMFVNPNGDRGPTIDGEPFWSWVQIRPGSTGGAPEIDGEAVP